MLKMIIILFFLTIYPHMNMELGTELIFIVAYLSAEIDCIGNGPKHQAMDFRTHRESPL